ncbi:MAG: PEP/pyruvate-binding domain-containing protein [Candidatus Thorarchaeota archaeon]|nr:PEP/pyruvate-binding domain-containing protein [Candidatus Thorarchaeota archaeon]
MDKEKKSLTQSLDCVLPEEVDLHGGKATNLASLCRKGFLVPRGFSISAENFVQMKTENPDVVRIIKKLENLDDFDEIIELVPKLETLIAGYKLSDDLKSAIEGEFERLEDGRSSEWGYAIRSSATIEDSKDVSFAGQAMSFLCVRDISHLFDAVKQVWGSTFSLNAIIYLKTKGIPISKVKMAVVIQEMIPASISGVMFTSNVVTNNSKEMLINATWGLGEALVSGKVIPDTYILAKSPLSIVQQEKGMKEVTSTALVTDNGIQSVLEETPKERREQFTLDERSLLKVAELGLEIEKQMKAPQDIEWCMRTNGELVILQSRPITTLSDLSL